MATYLETHYSKNEFSESAYPQKLCDHFLDTYIRPHFDGNIEGLSMLDVGAGKGNHLVGFARRGLKMYGLDKLKETNEVLMQFDVRECDLEKDPFPFESESFDIVFSKSVMEHVENADNFLAETKRVLKPGGLALLSCPDWGTQCHMYWDDYTHVKPWTRKGLQNAMKIHGFENVRALLWRQLPALWKSPSLEIVANILALAPESWKWKDKEESQHNEWIRFSKEKMLLGLGTK